jgi:hypothetical protein
MQRVPALSLRPSRRLRTLALTAHADILCAEPPALTDVLLPSRNRVC